MARALFFCEGALVGIAELLASSSNTGRLVLQLDGLADGKAAD
jgi:hypothetical protein